MKEKLKCILLVDDDEATNYIHEMVIKQVDWVESIRAVQGGHEALDYLKLMVDGKYPQPDIIFLDINMPAMSGWEFLEEYEKLQANQKAHIVVVMLTTSLNPEDANKAKEKSIHGFMNKPLTPAMVEELIKQHFSNRF